MLVPPVPNPEADPNRLMLAVKHKVEDVEDRPFLGNRVHRRGLSTPMLSQALLFSRFKHATSRMSSYKRSHTKLCSSGQYKTWGTSLEKTGV